MGPRAHPECRAGGTVRLKKRRAEAGVFTVERSERIEIVMGIIVSGVPEVDGQLKDLLASVEWNMLSSPDVHLSSEVKDERL